MIVPKAVRRERAARCRACPYRRIQHRILAVCALCGCPTAVKVLTRCPLNHW